MTRGLVVVLALAACASPRERCDAGLTLCEDACVDVQSDTRNCGGCGHNCRDSIAWPGCTAGSCVDACPQDAVCTPPASSCWIHRWACGGDFPPSCEATTEPGPEGSACDAGDACAAGTVWCRDACADLQTDPRNCGACGRDCHQSIAWPGCGGGHCFDACPQGAVCTRAPRTCRVARWSCHGDFPASCDETAEPLPSGTACDAGADCDVGTCG
jgi:hypothetical protein